MIPFGALLFVILWQSLARVVFNPYLKLLEARENATSGAVESSREKLAKAGELRTAYADQIAQARVEAMRVKLAAVAAAKKENGALVEKAEAAAQEALKQGRADIAREAGSLREQTLRDADGLADMIIDKIKSGSGTTRPGVQ